MIKKVVNGLFAGIETMAGFALWILTRPWCWALTVLAIVAISAGLTVRHEQATNQHNAQIEAVQASWQAVPATVTSSPELCGAKVCADVTAFGRTIHGPVPPRAHGLATRKGSEITVWHRGAVLTMTRPAVLDKQLWQHDTAGFALGTFLLLALVVLFGNVFAFLGLITIEERCGDRRTRVREADRAARRAARDAERAAAGELVPPKGRPSWASLVETA